jgi:hypothetical protein
MADRSAELPPRIAYTATIPQGSPCPPSKKASSQKELPPQRARLRTSVLLVGAGDFADAGDGDLEAMRTAHDREAGGAAVGYVVLEDGGVVHLFALLSMPVYADIVPFRSYDVSDLFSTYCFQIFSRINSKCAQQLIIVVNRYFVISETSLSAKCLTVTTSVWGAFVVLTYSNMLYVFICNYVNARNEMAPSPYVTDCSR